MKSAVLLFCLALAFAEISTAQNVIAPANRIELFNGTNFDGFTFCMRDDADWTKTWSVTNGLIHCNGTAIGYLRTKQSYSNYVVTVEWRFLYVTSKKNNTGVLVHMQLPDAVWPPCIQNQGKSGRQGDLFVMSGVECKEHRDMNANTPIPLRGEANEKAVGEWNTNVTVCAGNDVKAVINGKLLNEITGCTVASGFVGIQSEGADFEIRKMFVESLLHNDDSADPVDRLVADLSATHGDWENGAFPVLGLPQTASPEDVIHKLFNMGLPSGETAHYKILRIQQVHIPIAEIGLDLYTAIVVRKDSSDKIVLIRYHSTAVGWWSRVYDIKP